MHGLLNCLIVALGLHSFTNSFTGKYASLLSRDGGNMLFLLANYAVGVAEPHKQAATTALIEVRRRHS